MPRPITPSGKSIGSPATQLSVMESPMKTTFVGVVNAPLAARYLHKFGQSLFARSSVESGSGGRHGSETIAVVGAVSAPSESAWTPLGAHISTNRNAGASAVCCFINRLPFKLAATTFARLQVIANLDKHDSSQPRRSALVLSTKNVAIGSVAWPGNSMSQFFWVFAQPVKLKARGSSPSQTPVKVGGCQAADFAPRHGQTPRLLVHDGDVIDDLRHAGHLLDLRCGRSLFKAPIDQTVQIYNMVDCLDPDRIGRAQGRILIQLCPDIRRDRGVVASVGGVAVSKCRTSAESTGKSKNGCQCVKWFRYVHFDRLY